MKPLQILFTAVLVAGIAVFSVTRLAAQTPGPQNCPGYGMMNGQGPGAMGAHGPGGYGMMQGMNGPADHAFMQSMWSMHQGMSGRTFTGDADRDFMNMMIPQHQAAINMARAELQYGKNPKVRALAQQIINANQARIDQLNALLK